MQEIENHLIPKEILSQKQPKKALTVSQLNRAAKDLLEGEFFNVLVEGEISNLTKHSSGHWYLTLKDAGAQIRCAMFRNRNILCKTKAANGIAVAVTGKISLYENRGEYQLIIDSMQDAGIGALQAKFEELKSQLQREGLFLATHKKALPKNPRRIALVTSKTGAAVRDLLSVFSRRFAQIDIDIVPVLVQGDQAAGQIAQAVDWLSQLGMHDAIIVGRGGGSIEDLWAFNEEVVARAIFNCPIPIVSAVGHETDITIADFVADVRAPTPSAAAELLSPDSNEHHQRLAQLKNRIQRAWQRTHREKNQLLAATRQRLAHPRSRIEQLNQRLDELDIRAQRIISNRLSNLQQVVDNRNSQLRALSPQRQLQLIRQRLESAKTDLLRNQRNHIQRKKEQLAWPSAQIRPLLTNSIKDKHLRFKHIVAMLNSYNPLEVVQRGFSITRNTGGQLVKSISQVGTGEKIQVQLQDGHLSAEITDIKP